MKHELQQQLFDKYPSLFRERTLPPEKSLMCFGCDHGDGWYDILEDICTKINAIDTKNEVTFSQIKEKFGELRIYFNFSGEDEDVYRKVEDIIAAGEEISGITCERCGQPGTIRPGGWIRVLCDGCARK